MSPQLIEQRSIVTSEFEQQLPDFERRARDGSDPARRTVAVVICTYSQQRWTPVVAAIRSVLQQTRPVDELVVVVDHNPDLRDRLIQRFSDVCIIDNPDAIGLSSARNAGMRATSSDIIAFLDDDALAAPTWLERLLENYRDDRVIGVGGRIEPQWLNGRPAWFPDEFLWVVGCTFHGAAKSHSQVRNMIGANMSFRRELVDLAGGFLDSFARVGSHPFGADETDFCIRASDCLPNGSFWYEPDAFVTHRVTADRTALRYFLRHTFNEGRAKAMIGSVVGSHHRLATETTFVRTVLPRAIVGNLVRALRHGEPAGVLRAGAIILGLSSAIVGYGLTRARTTISRLSHRAAASRFANEGTRVETLLASESPQEARKVSQGLFGYRQTVHDPSPVDFRPIYLTEVDLAGTLPSISTRMSDGRRYQRIAALVRLSGQPVGIANLPTDRDRVTPLECYTQIRKQLGRDLWTRWGADRLNDVSNCAMRPPAPLDGVAETTDADISIVIPTHERPTELRACLRSILSGAVHPLEIIVVDNGPITSSTFHLIDDEFADEPLIRYLCEPRRGSARARNTGWRDAQGEIVAFLDDDVVVDRRWLIELTKGFGSRSDATGVTGLILPFELETPAQLWLEQAGGFSKGFEPRTFNLTDRRPADPLFPFRVGSYGSGGNMALRRDALEALGGFDERLGQGTAACSGEDIDLLLRTILSGKTLAYVPAALVRHRHPRDYSALCWRMYSYGVGMTVVLLRSLAAHPRLIVSFARKLPRGIVAALSQPTAYSERVMTSYPAELKRLELRGILRGLAVFSSDGWRGLRREAVPDEK